MVRITDVKPDGRQMITVYCVHGYIKLRGERQIEKALGHTGIRFFPKFSREYLREMLVGRLAQVDKRGFRKTAVQEQIQKERKTFTIRIQILRKKEKKGQNG